ncbi:hypothetical protein NDU88_004752 [Pleurodeles waltl]|uniref:Uncharacterized protein n=1 Tax=Pleurodeles waltl TaxID=8319 RepID=A0AAV7NN74_PLEWA|nr:hypothetical protein NDU88_004752 [Pleurodeles waltl]
MVVVGPRSLRNYTLLRPRGPPHPASLHRPSCSFYPTLGTQWSVGAVTARSAWLWGKGVRDPPGSGCRSFSTTNEERQYSQPCTTLRCAPEPRAKSRPMPCSPEQATSPLQSCRCRAVATEPPVIWRPVSVHWKPPLWPSCGRGLPRSLRLAAASRFLHLGSHVRLRPDHAPPV